MNDSSEAKKKRKERREDIIGNIIITIIGVTYVGNVIWAIVESNLKGDTGGAWVGGMILLSICFLVSINSAETSGIPKKEEEK